MNKYNYNDFANEVKGKEIDIFISSSSFEERCFVTAMLSQSFKPRESVFFYNANEIETIITNAEKLVDASSNASKIKLDSDKPVDNYFIIDKFLTDRLAFYNKPTLLIDSTTFTHETLLILLRLVQLKREFLGKIYISYLGAESYSINESADSEKWLSKGIKQIRTILGYSGFTNPTVKNHLVLLFGFESERTKRIIEEYEYDYITLGFGGNYTMENHMKINYERHAELLKEYPNARKFTFSLLDPYETKKQILQYLNTEELRDLNTVIAPLNNKISTIGAGLAAMANENIQLAYAKPNIYNTDGYSTPNEDIYLYELIF